MLMPKAPLTTADAGKLGGKSNSDKKIAAVRKNGKKGGQRIQVRTATGWRKSTKPTLDRTHCGECKAKLWKAPHGGVYCDRVHS
jgi:hypothetical protein